MPPSFDDLYRAAIRLHQQGNPADAARLYDDVLRLRPDHAGALHLKGVLALQAGQNEAAIGLIRRSLRIAPRQAMALSNLGVALRGLGRNDEAAAALREAVAIEPGSADAQANLGQTLIRLGEVREAVVHLRRAFEIDPRRLGLKSSLLFAENFLAETDPLLLAAEARKLGETMQQSVTMLRTHANDPDPERKLRVGLVSGDLRAHPVGRFLVGPLAAVDPARIELVAYSNNRREDQVTTALKASVPSWNVVSGMPDAALAAKIAGDQIDVLVDLSGHTESHRLLVFARKPAPVAVTYLGYFGTTGLTAIDYVLANDWVVPAREADQWVEAVWRMPDTYLCFSAPADAPPPTPLPALRNGYVTFGSFNNFNKLSDGTLAAWGKLLAAVPNSRVILRSSGDSSPAAASALERRLADAAIDLARVRIDPRIGDYAQHLRSYGEIDMALDPFPYNGGTTTVEALYMGVPVLVRAGDRYVAHMGESILNLSGLAGWVAPNEPAYVELGARLAGDIDGLTALRSALRERMLASPLFDARRFAGNLEAAFRGMWRAWCAAQRRA